MSGNSKRTCDEFLASNDNADSATHTETTQSQHGSLEPPAKQRRTEASADSVETMHDNAEDDPLVSLLDFTDLDTQSAISARFSEIAENLLQHYRIEITTSSTVEQLELLEIEFYLYKPGCHEDPFTHGSVEQCQAGQWYFHRPPSRSNELGTPTAFASGYRGGTRKGLDITIGHPAPAVTSKYFSAGNAADGPASSPSKSTSTSTLRGGILLRSIRRQSDNTVISGPSLLVDEILRLSGASKIPDLIADVWQNDISAFPSSSASPSSSAPRRSTMRLLRVSPAPRAPSAPEASLRIYRSPRIGLDLSHSSISTTNLRTHPRVLFLGAPYRFFAHPHFLTANGRGQTFLGVYDALDAAGAHAVYSLEMWRAIETATRWKFLTVKNCFAEYRTGVEGAYEDYGKPLEEVLGQWVGRKGVSGSMTGWLRMMGTLRRFLNTAEKATVVAEGQGSQD